MAELYLARAKGIEGFEKIVVIKRILPELAGTPEIVQMFLNEARTAATFHHPNIVQVYDIGSIGKNYFFSMEFLHGQDVRALLKTATAREVEIPIEIAISIVIGICAGLHYAHEKTGFDGTPLNVIHRDVSPQNIFITYDGCVKVVDFGIAKTANQIAQTRLGAIKGKFSYMSPEQCQALPLDRRSDIFSAAIVLYELTCHRKLFPGNEFEVLKTIVETEPPAPSIFRPSYPPELERITMKGLAKDPADRFQTAQELQIALEEFAREHKLSISSISLTRFIGELFGPEIAALRAALRDQRSLVDHLQRQTRQLPSFTGDESTAAIESATTSDSPSAVRKVRSHARRRSWKRVAVGLCALATVASVAVVWKPWRERSPGQAAEIPLPPEPTHEATSATPKASPAAPEAPRDPTPTSPSVVQHEVAAPVEELPRAKSESEKATRSRKKRVSQARSTEPEAAPSPSPTPPAKPKNLDLEEPLPF